MRHLLIVLFVFVLAGCEQLIYGDDAYLDEVSHDALREKIFGDELSEGGFTTQAEGEETQVMRAEAAVNEREATETATRSFSTIDVRKGDTLYSLARRHGLSVAELAGWNGLVPPYMIKPGQRLRLSAVEQGGQDKTRSTHTVRKGETVYGIAKQHGVSIADLITANAIKDVSQLAVGKTLHLGVADEGTKQEKTPVALSSSVKRIKKDLLPKKRYFLSPLASRGEILMGFGKLDNGYHNDGINIASKQGTAVRVVEDGVVAYRGDDVKGFGHLVLVSHGGGWTSAYAHLSEVKVVQGQQLTRGALLGHVGASGHVTRPQLHFELRYHRQAVDPRAYVVEGSL